MEILIECPLDYFDVKEWKRRYFVLKYDFKSGVRYVEFYKDKNWRKQLPKHVINLHPGYEVSRIKNDPKKKYKFTVETTDHSLTLASDDEHTMNEWIATLEEYNVVKSFCVQPQDTPTMVKIDAIFPCHLQLVNSEVRLVSAMDGKVLGVWPFKCIRRYKFDGNVFCIEAGRKAPTGQGLFQFISNECSEIYRVMDNIIRSKAMDPTTRQPTSTKPQNAAVKHSPVKKTQSVPPTCPKSNELHYDYATPECEIIDLPNSNSPPVRIPSLPTRSSSTERGLESDNSYDVLCPVDQSQKDDRFESNFSNVPDTMGKLEQDNSYDSLRFNKPSSSQGGNDVEGASSDVYNTLQFDQRDGKASYLKTGHRGSYDKLQFNRSPNNLTSFEDGTSEDNKTDGFDSCDGVTSNNIYNTLSHLQISQSASHDNGNTYDYLADSTSSYQPNANTYDSLAADTTTSVERPPKHPVPEKPVAPPRPLPRKKPSGSQDEVLQQSKKPARSKPARLPKQRRETPDTPSSPNTAQENLKDIIQQRLTKPDGNDDAYATIEHDYASIDYSKVAKPDSEPAAHGVYSEPFDPGSKPIPSNVPARTKLKQHAPKGMKGIFKRTPALPKSKTPPTPTSDGNAHFADELKRKLQNQVKKSGRTAQSQHADEGIYDEVHNSSDTYSLPFENEMDV